MEATVFQLQPTTSHKSFYGKATVITETNGGKTVSKLKSYETIVAEYHHEEKKVIINGWYSATTNRHINAFLNYYGFSQVSKKDIKDCPMILNK